MKKKNNNNINHTLKKSEEALNNIAKALAVPPVAPVYDASNGLTEFISATLQSFKSPTLKIETTQKILNILMDAQLRDISKITFYYYFFNSSQGILIRVMRKFVFLYIYIIKLLIHILKPYYFHNM